MQYIHKFSVSLVSWTTWKYPAVVVNMFALLSLYLHLCTHHVLKCPKWHPIEIIINDPFVKTSPIVSFHILSKTWLTFITRSIKQKTLDYCYNEYQSRNLLRVVVFISLKSSVIFIFVCSRAIQFYLVYWHQYYPEHFMLRNHFVFLRCYKN